MAPSEPDRTQPFLTLGERIAEARENLGLSQRGLARLLVGQDAAAKRADNMRRTIIRYEKNETVPSASSARRLAEMLEVPPDSFVSAARGRGGALADLVRNQAVVEERVARLEERIAELLPSRPRRRGDRDDG